MRPTVSDRVLVHLAAFDRYANEIDCPAEVTQHGIGRALTISRAHAALEVKKLVVAGRALQRLAHVRGSRHRRKVYFLTATGHRRVAEVAAAIRAKRVTVLFSNGDRRDLPGSDALGLLAQAGVREHQALLRLLDSDVVSLSGGSGPKPPSHFVGRVRELAVLRAFAASASGLLFLYGPAGIGKSALAARALVDHRGPWIWHACRHPEGPEGALRSIARHLDAFGRPALSRCLDRGDFSGNVLEALRRDAGDLVIVLDDADRSQDALAFARGCARSGVPVRFLAIVRHRPPEAFEEGLELGALAGAEADALLHRLRPDLGPTARAEIAASAGGVPVLLEVAAACGAADRDPLQVVLERLEPRELDALRYAAVFQRPFPTEAFVRSYVPLHRLLRLRVVVARAEGDEVPRLVADRVLAGVDRGRRLRMHSRAAAYFAEDGDVVQEAMHLLQADRPAEAASRLSEEGRRLVAGGRAPTLVSLLEECARSGVEEPAYLAARMEACRGAGLEASAWDLAERLLRSTEPGLRLRASLAAGEILLERGDAAAATGRLLEAKRIAGSLEDLESEGRAYLGLGRAQRLRENPYGAVELFAKGERLLLASGNRSLAAGARLLRAQALGAAGEITAALAELEPLAAQTGELGARAAHAAAEVRALGPAGDVAAESARAQELALAYGLYDLLPVPAEPETDAPLWAAVPGSTVQLGMP